MSWEEIKALQGVLKDLILHRGLYEQSIYYAFPIKSLA